MTVEFESSFVETLLTEYCRMGANGRSNEGEQHETSHKTPIQEPFRQTEQFIKVNADRSDVFSKFCYP
jgi:hypothetical protein